MAKYKLHKSDIVLVNVHNKKSCKGEYCCIHNPSRHALADWPQHWREDRRIMERISPFGCGCPDPDSPAETDRVHGCVMNPYTKKRGVCSPWEIDGSEAAWIDKDYAVTKDGRVWSFLKSMGPKNGNVYISDYSNPKQLKPRDNGKGYRSVFLGKGREEYIHRLVLTAWTGLKPTKKEALEARHLNGIRNDNRLENIEWSDRTTNNMDKHEHKTMPLGESHKNSKLTQKIVDEAKILWEKGMTLARIVEELDLSVCKQTLHEAVTGKTWKSNK